MKVSTEGLQLLKSLEGLRLRRYPDGKGWSIGYGHFIKPNEDYKQITLEKAEELLKQDVEEVETAIDRLVTIPLSQNEWDALVSFLYNIGETQFRGSDTLKILNSGDKEKTAEWLKKWIYVTVQGARLRSDALENRRKKEADLWLGRA